MRVLIACEFSGTVRKEFEALGHEAWSCDLLPTEIPGNHYQGDVRDMLSEHWDLMVAHPPCTHLAVSGARWFKEKQTEQAEALEFVRLLMSAPIERIAIENPISIISSRIRKPDQIIQPWQFGHGETKATCLWLKGLPKLQPTNIVEGREQRVHKMPPSPDRWRERSRTFPGIASAMAQQWGGLAFQHRVQRTCYAATQSVVVAQPAAANANRWKAKNMSLVYDVILADPPWAYEVWNKDTGSGRSAESHYPTMSLDDICALPISNLAADNCALFMWAVWPSIFDAQKVIEAWGFKYKTLAFEWFKMNTSGKGWHVGMGYYTRANPEPCLLAVRGSMPVAVHDERNTLTTYTDQMFGLPMVEKVKEHSRKPEEQYRKVEALYPNMRYLELFARRQRPGWDVFGNQVKGSIRLPTKHAPDKWESSPSTGIVPPLSLSTSQSESTPPTCG